MAVPVERWLFTVEEFHRLAEVGLLHEDERVELIEGELIRMNPIEPGHSGHVNRLNRLFGRLLGDHVLLSIQNPVRLNDRTEPQPDLALLRPRDDDYSRATPTPADVLLLVEVADMSLAYDRDVKGPLYAAAGIREYWLVNLLDGRIEVYRDPGPAGYARVETLGPGDTLRPLTFPDLAIPVSDVLG